MVLSRHIRQNHSRQHRWTLAATMLIVALSQTSACESVTTITPEDALQVQAKPPAAPLPDLPPIPQPPPPPRVTIDGDLLTLDEALSFDDAEKLSPEHADILTEVAKWLAKHPEALELSVEVQVGGEGSKRALQKRSAAMAQQIVDALLAEGIDAARVLAVGLGKSEDGLRHVTLRVSKRPEETKP